MNQQSTLPISGKLNIKVIDKDGNIKDERNVSNLVVKTGLVFIAETIINTTPPAKMSHMAIGTSNTAVASGNSALGGEVQRVGNIASSVEAAPNNNTITFTATFPPVEGTDYSITEAGIFNAGTNGTMLCRTVFGVVTKAASDALAITWSITIGAGA